MAGGGAHTSGTTTSRARAAKAPSRAPPPPQVFIVIAYFMIGLTTDGAGYFFIAWLVLITASLTLTACFRLLACAILSPAAAQAASGFTLLVVIVGSGYIIVRRAIPPWMIWLYWLSPFSWSVRALAVNEMTSPKWQGATALASGAEAGTVPAGQSLGDSALESFDFYKERCARHNRSDYFLFRFSVRCVHCSCRAVAC